MKIVLYDKTCAGEGWRPGLSTTWHAGTVMNRGLGRLDAAFGATSWDEALGFAASAKEPIEELQYWGHGKWGCVKVDQDGLDAASLVAGHRLRPLLEAVRERLTPDALVWFRTCEAFGARAGHDFAQRIADFFGRRVAGHTFVIHALQSGLHGLLPGNAPYWPIDEGLEEGTPDAPKKALWSSLLAPRTITCLANRVPERWFA